MWCSHLQTRYANCIFPWGCREHVLILFNLIGPLKNTSKFALMVPLAQSILIFGSFHAQTFLITYKFEITHEISAQSSSQSPLHWPSGVSFSKTGTTVDFPGKYGTRWPLEIIITALVQSAFPLQHYAIMMFLERCILWTLKYELNAAIIIILDFLG